jgi:hypothetical protein
MSRILRALSVVMAVVSPFVMAIVGAVVALAVTHSGEASPDDHSRPTGAGRMVVSDDVGTVHVFLDVAENDVSRNVVVHGAGRAELAVFHLYRKGGFALEPARADPIGFTVGRKSSGLVYMSVLSKRNVVSLNARPDGSTRLLVKNAFSHPVYDMPIVAQGDIVRHGDMPAR